MHRTDGSYGFIRCHSNNLETGLLLTVRCESSVGACPGCARVFLMSRAAVNDSIRLFLNALVTPMGRPDLEYARSAE